jgi:hypothetical protein
VVGYTNDSGEYMTGQVAFIDIVGGQVNLILNDDYNTSVPYSSIEQAGYPIQTSG